MQVAVLKWLFERARAATGKTFQALASYNFRLFFIGQLISNTGNQLTNVALILFVLKLSHSGLAVGALAVVAFVPHPSIAVLYALALAGGTLLAFDNPLRRSFVPEMVSKDELPNAVVLYSTIVALSQVSGPALAGVLVATVGFGRCFALDAVTYLAVIACLVTMRESELFRQPPGTRTGREVREGFGYVAGGRAPIAIGGIVCVAAAGLGEIGRRRFG